MKKEQINTCLELTQEMIIRYFYGNPNYILDNLHEDCFWIGTRGDEFYQGKEDIIRVMGGDHADIPKVYITSQHFYCASHDTHQCVICGSYIGVTSPETGEIYRDMQRASIVWKEEKGRLFIIHMHFSNPLQNIVKDEKFPHGVGRYTKEYLDALIARDVDKSDAISIKDQKNTYHIVKVSSILYCEAFDRNSIIHTQEGDIFGRILLQDLEQLLTEKNEVMFRRVHKSFLLSKYYVVTVKRYEATLWGDYHVPLSQERYKDIKKWLMA